MLSHEVVDQQVDAYNRHDLDAFIACYSPDATVRRPDGSVTLDGSAAIGGQYGEWFRSLPELRVEVSQRVAAGGWVVDHERVTLGDGNEMVGLVAYEVQHGLIRSVVLLTDET